MAWLFVLCGLAMGPLGLVSVFLVISQPVFLNALCTLRLVSAVIPVAMIGPAMDEDLASLQHLRREQARGRSFWRALGNPGEAARRGG
jgi:hypothetical protein